MAPDVIARNKESFDRLAARYRSEAAYRAAVDRDPREALQGIGMPIPAGVQVRIAADSDEVMHIVMPPDPNTDLADEALEMVAGGNTVGTAGTAGTMSTALSSTMVSTAGTASCASTAGSN